MNALASVGATPGLAGYMAVLETRLSRAVARRPGAVSSVAGEALAAGGKRLRPLLCFLSASDGDSELLLSAGVATELVHMATLVHDDLVDGAHMRRGAPSAWSVFGAGAALSAGDYLFACAFAELAETEDSAAVAILAEACLALARGEAMQRRADPPAGDADRRISRALCIEDREALRGRVPARLGRRSGPRLRTAWRSGSRSRSPTTSSTARARPRRPGRSRAPICAREHRRCRSCSRRSRTRSSGARSRADRSKARSSGSPALTRSSGRGRPRSTTRPRRDRSLRAPRIAKNWSHSPSPW